MKNKLKNEIILPMANLRHYQTEISRINHTFVSCLLTYVLDVYHKVLGLDLCTKLLLKKIKTANRINAIGS